MQLPNLKKALICIFLLALCVITKQSATAQFKLANSVFGNGGSRMSSSADGIVGIAGQIAVGTSLNTSSVIQSGFWVQTTDFVTGTKRAPSEMTPKEFQLFQNYPNPFNPTTTIQFAVPKSSHISLKIFDLLGRQVIRLIDKKLQPGNYTVILDASSLASGIYFYKIQSEEFSATKKLALIK